MCGFDLVFDGDILGVRQKIAAAGRDQIRPDAESHEDQVLQAIRLPVHTIRSEKQFLNTAVCVQQRKKAALHILRRVPLQPAVHLHHLYNFAADSMDRTDGLQYRQSAQLER